MTTPIEQVTQATWGVLIARQAEGEKIPSDPVGTGCFVTPNLFLTAGHVLHPKPPKEPLGPGDSIRLYKISQDGRIRFTPPLVIQYESFDPDIAILKAPFKVPSYAKVSISGVAPGTGIGLLGYAREAEITPHLEVVKGLVRERQRGTYTEVAITTIDSKSGYSGGPVFLLETVEVIGIHHGRLYGEAGSLVSGQSVAVLLTCISKLLEQHGILS